MALLAVALVVLHAVAVQLFAVAVAPAPDAVAVAVPDVVVLHAVAVQLFVVAVAPFPDVAVVPGEVVPHVAPVLVVPCVQVALLALVKAAQHDQVFEVSYLQ